MGSAETAIPNIRICIIGSLSVSVTQKRLFAVIHLPCLRNNGVGVSDRTLLTEQKIKAKPKSFSLRNPSVSAPTCTSHVRKNIHAM